MLKLSIKNTLKSIIAELSKTFEKIESTQVDSLIKRILGSKKILVAGAGRSGLAMRAFGMRLMHMGLNSFVVGEMVTPNLSEDDVLIIGSGSGSTGSLVVMAEKAKAIGAEVASITVQPNSPIGRLSDTVVTVPAPTPKTELDTEFDSIQPMGSLFEQSLFLLLDAVVLLLMNSSGQRSDQMFARHANLE